MDGDGDKQKPFERLPSSSSSSSSPAPSGSSVFSPSPFSGFVYFPFRGPLGPPKYGTFIQLFCCPFVLGVNRLRLGSSNRLGVMVSSWMRWESIFRAWVVIKLYGVAVGCGSSSPLGPSFTRWCVRTLRVICIASKVVQMYLLTSLDGANILSLLVIFHRGLRCRL